ncbi:MAG: hypothetical protein AAB581_00430, partial [Patescibacteria group bacterium]
LSVALAFTTTVSLSGFALLFAVAANAQVASLMDGDLVRGPDGIKVYIVKPEPHGAYTGWKRHIFNPAVFNMYGHLSWSNIKSVNQATIDAYQTSDLYRADVDPKVYSLEEMGSSAVKHWIENEAAFASQGYSWSQIFIVNEKERDYYASGSMITSGTPAPTPTPTGSGLTVSLASDTPAAGSIVADSTSGDGAQAQASLLKANFMAGSDGDVMVTTVKVKRNGISADADLANAYLYDGAVRVAEMTNVSGNYITFTSAAGLFTVSRGSSKAITVKIDVTNGTSAGKTIALSINAASDVVAGSAAVAGSFPVMGNFVTTAAVGDLGKVTIANVSPAAAATVDPGQTGYEVWRFSVQATDQKVNLHRVRVTNVGSIATTDLTNIKLMDAGTQLGATAASLGVDGTVTFDMSASPFQIVAGQTKNLSLVADVIGGTNRTFRFSIQRSADITAMDDNYAVYLKPNQADSFSIVQAGGATTVNTGALTISVDPASPTGNVAKDYIDQEMARFKFKASGEGVKVSSLAVTATTVPAAWGVNNVKLYLDGTQVGSTSDVSSGTTTTFTFGNSFIVPSGTTKTLVVKGEVKAVSGSSYAAGHTIQLILSAGSANAQGQVSLTSISTTASSGNTLTVQTGTLTATLNSGLNNASSSLPTGVRGATAVKIGSFILTAGSGEAVSVSQMVVKNSDAIYALGVDFQNLKLMNGANQIGNQIGTLSTTASATYTFTPSSSITINAGQQYVVDVFADVLTGASNYSGGTGYPSAGLSQVIWDDVTATGLSTSGSAGVTTDVTGQTVYVSAGGSLTVAAASDMPIAQNRAMGETGQTLATFKFTTGAPEAVNITKIIVSDTMASTASAATGSITNLSLWKDGIQVGPTVASMTASGTQDVIATFNGLTLNLTRDTATILTLKGNINGYPNAVSGSTHTFKVYGPADVTATGATGGSSITPTIASVAGNAQRVFRAELTVTNAMSNMSGGQGTDQVIGKYRLTNTSAGNYSITVTDIDLGLTTSIANTESATASRYVTLKRDSASGTTIAKKAYKNANYGDITSWTPVGTYDFTELAFGATTIDAAGGTGYVDIYVLADTNDADATESISTAIGSGSNVITWADGITGGITTVDGMPVPGANITY